MNSDGAYVVKFTTDHSARSRPISASPPPPQSRSSSHLRSPSPISSAPVTHPMTVARNSAPAHSLPASPVPSIFLIDLETDLETMSEIGNGDGQEPGRQVWDFEHEVHMINLQGTTPRQRSSPALSVSSTIQNLTVESESLNGNGGESRLNHSHEVWSFVQRRRRQRRERRKAVLRERTRRQYLSS